MLRAVLRLRGKKSDVLIVNASTKGLSLTAEHSPPRGEIVEVMINGLVLVGLVRWNRGNRFGVALQERINPALLSQGIVRTQTSGVQQAHAAETWSKRDLAFIAAGAAAALAFLFLAVRMWL